MKRSALTLVLLAAALVALPAAADDASALFAAAPADCAAPAAAAPAAADQPLFLAGEVCGSNICGKGTYCCNASCSNCVPFGFSCTQQVCNATEAVAAGPVEPVEVDHGGLHPAPRPCGDNFCTGDTFCCNASCGICAPRGGACTQQFCPPTS